MSANVCLFCLALFEYSLTCEEACSPRRDGSLIIEECFTADASLQCESCIGLFLPVSARRWNFRVFGCKVLQSELL